MLPIFIKGDCTTDTTSQGNFEYSGACNEEGVLVDSQVINEAESETTDNSTETENNNTETTDSTDEVNDETTNDDTKEESDTSEEASSTETKTSDPSTVTGETPTAQTNPDHRQNAKAGVDTITFSSELSKERLRRNYLIRNTVGPILGGLAFIAFVVIFVIIVCKKRNAAAITAKLEKPDAKESKTKDKVTAGGVEVDLE